MWKGNAEGSAITYVYDAAGRLSAECPTVAPTSVPCGTCYVFGDALGSARTVVDGVTRTAFYLKTGTYVTVPSEIPAGASSGTVEHLLEIGPGKGTNSVTFQMPNSNLAVPPNGSTTSGGLVQFQLRNPAQVNPSELHV